MTCQRKWNRHLETSVKSLNRHKRKFESFSTNTLWKILWNYRKLQRFCWLRQRERLIRKIHQFFLDRDAPLTWNNRRFMAWWQNVQAMPRHALGTVQSSSFDWQFQSKQLSGFFSSRAQSTNLHSVQNDSLALSSLFMLSSKKWEAQSAKVMYMYDASSY